MITGEYILTSHYEIKIDLYRDVQPLLHFDNHHSFSNKPFLPFNERHEIDCRRDPTEANIGCFLAGDVRVNEQVLLFDELVKQRGLKRVLVV